MRRARHHHVRQGRDGLEVGGRRCREARGQGLARRRILDGGQLRLERRLVERGQLLNLDDELLDLGARVTARELVAVGGDPRNQGRRDLIVDGVAQRLEALALPVDGGRQVAHLDDVALIGANVEAPLQLVREQVVPRLLEAVERQVALEEARRVPRLVLGAGEPAVRAHLRELVIGMRLDEELLEDVAAHQVVVVGKRVPLPEIAREQVGDVHALVGERLGPGLAERRAEPGVAAARTHDAPVGELHGSLLAVLANAIVLGIRPLLLGEAEPPVLVELGDLGVRQRGAARERRERPPLPA